MSLLLSLLNLLNWLLRTGISLIIVSFVYGLKRIIKNKQLIQGSAVAKYGAITGGVMSLFALASFLLWYGAESISVEWWDIALLSLLCIVLLWIFDEKREREKAEIEREKRIKGSVIKLMVEKKNSWGWEFVRMIPFPLYRKENGTIFAILSGYGREYYPNIKPISEAKGLPDDVSGEVAKSLSSLVDCSYLTLEEINAFNWNAECECDVYGINMKNTYKKWGDEFYNRVIPYLNLLNTDLNTDKPAKETDVRVVFGYRNCE